MRERFFEGEDAAEGNKLVAAIVYVHHVKFPSEKSFPRVVEAKKGWKKLAPPRSRLPCPLPVVAAVVNAYMAEGDLTLALLTITTFVLYLRPSEGLTLAVGDLIAPQRAGAGQVVFLV